MVNASSAPRRDKCRYPIERIASYRHLKDKSAESFQGRTVNISSAEITFTTVNKIEEGSIMELTVRWPVLLHDTIPMKLVISGTVLKSNTSTATITMGRHEFRTQRRATSE
jgi:hypothetical protein